MSEKGLYKAVGPSDVDASRTILHVVKKFDQMELKDELFRGILAYGLKEPFLIQQRAILPCIETNDDFIIQAHASSGKTIASTISILQRIDTNLNECQALILTPIDESVMQIQKIITILGIYMGTRCYAFPTDLNISDDISLLEQDATPHIIIGTPNSVLDMINRGAFSTEYINMFVLDEADEMLFPRFKYPIYNVLMTLPPNVQVILVSNTMSTEAMEESLCLVRKPIQIAVEKKELTFESVKQYYVVVKREVWKFSTLLDLSKTMTGLKVIVYCNTREKVDWLTCNLDRQNFRLPITAIHGGMDQEERDHRMRLFNGGSKSVIITTDIISDIDFLIISLVINYDLPLNCENYIRRIRPDFKRYCNNPRGVISLVTANEKKILKDFGKTYNMRNEEMPSSLNFRAESSK